MEKANPPNKWFIFAEQEKLEPNGLLVMNLREPRYRRDGKGDCNSMEYIESQKFRQPKQPDLNILIRSIESNSQDVADIPKNYLKVPELSVPPRLKSQSSQARWKPLPENTWKMNVDASWSDQRKCGGIGWILRDSIGSPICMGIQRINASWSVKMLEMKAILEGWEAYLQCKQTRSDLTIPPIVVESYAGEVVKILNGDEEDLMKIGFFVEEILQSKASLEDLSF